jgi:hypothetical protein
LIFTLYPEILLHHGGLVLHAEASKPQSNKTMG